MNRLDSAMQAAARNLYTDFARVVETCLGAKEDAPAPRAAELPAGIDALLEGDTYVVLVDLPGVAKEDIEVTVGGRVCVLSYSRAMPSRKDDDVLLSERRFGQGQRKLRFSDELADDGYSARLSDGVLELRLPKKLNRAQRVTVE